MFTAAVVENGDRLLTKVRLAYVIDDEELTGRAKQYALLRTSRGPPPWGPCLRAGAPRRDDYRGPPPEWPC